MTLLRSERYALLGAYQDAHNLCWAFFNVYPIIDDPKRELKTKLNGG